MSDIQNGPDWWLGTDGKWYPPAAPAPAPPTGPPPGGQLPPPPATDGGAEGEGYVTEPPPRARRRWLIPVIAIVVLLGVSAGVAAFYLIGRSDDTSHQLTGAIILQDAVDLSGKEGKPCSGDGGYDDMRSGAQVKVSDDTGKVLATGYLASGTTQTAMPGMSLTYCYFALLVEKKLPKRDFYVVEVSHRGAMTYSYEDLEAQGWNLSLTLG